jgi:hypothetical protein
LTGSYFFCANYCPTSFTGTQPDCTPPVPGPIFSGAFKAFDGPFNSNSDAVYTTGRNVLPAKARGQYFNGSDADMTFNSFTLNIDFSLMGYFRPDDLAADYTLFSKDTNSFGPSSRLLIAYIENTTGALKLDISDSDDYSQTGTAELAGLEALVP